MGDFKLYKKQMGTDSIKSYIHTKSHAGNKELMEA